MLIILSLILLFCMAVFAFMRLPKFGKSPYGERLKRIKKSPHYKNGAFRNLSHTPNLTEGVSYYSVSKEFFFGEKKRVTPADAIPFMKTDLLTLSPDADVLVWFGHSSYFIQIDGKKILVDPVFSGAASPIPSTTRAFTGTDPYTAEDIPEIDFLLITHDHWDHIDYQTILKLKPKIKQVICGLGNGGHFEHWGFEKNIIVEMDWNEYVSPDDGFTVHAVPARHFSGRGFVRNKSLWVSFVLQTPTFRVFIGGDSGYDTHFAEIGKTFGAFDLVILDNGQYDKSWKYIHMRPEEVLQAAMDLQARRLLPVHSSKFALANHPWDEPLEKITTLNKEINLNLLTPLIGERVNLKDGSQIFSQWWKDLK